MYRALCLTLAGAGAEVEWPTLSAGDWDRLASLASEEVVAPLLFAAVRSGEPHGLAQHMPSPVRDQLARTYYSTTARNQVRFQEMDRFLPALGEAGIPVVVLKGAALAETVYPEAGLRPMSDVDLLIPARWLRESIRILKTCGYTLLKITSHAVLEGGPHNAVFVELHWALVPNKAQSQEKALAWFWERTQPLPRCPIVSMFSPTSNWLYVLSHLAVQNQASLMELLKYYDLWLLATTYAEDIDWRAIVEQAIFTGWLAAIPATFGGLQERFGLETPQTLIQLTEPLSAKMTNDYYVPYNEYTRQAILSLDGWTRFYALWYFTFPSLSYLRLRYSPGRNALLPFYYLRRWWEIAAAVKRG